MPVPSVDTEGSVELVDDGVASVTTGEVSVEFETSGVVVELVVEPAEHVPDTQLKPSAHGQNAIPSPNAQNSPSFSLSRQLLPKSALEQHRPSPHSVSSLQL